MNKSAALCNEVEVNILDILVVSVTWREKSGTFVLKGVMQTVYKCIYGPRQLPVDTDLDSMGVHNHGGLVIIYRSSFDV